VPAFERTREHGAVDVDAVVLGSLSVAAVAGDSGADTDVGGASGATAQPATTVSRGAQPVGHAISRMHTPQDEIRDATIDIRHKRMLQGAPPFGGRRPTYVTSRQSACRLQLPVAGRGRQAAVR
jgi:hypothetical protein